ncbi:peroxidase-related enzyme [Muricauda sp. TY007]|uniref:carboxymuconolactone decarboxylase family protein n=1 Tax=Allomuricauda sp. TY007 TaxID=2683200 RepID=UPI0013C21484|nr:peroxidase-related enzyme [Muricauda sp. TY007]NDV17153.1 peroxidase-related enzyme [Muricauda sp. TY007]
MAHIKIDENLPGIRGLMHFRPETAQPMNDLAEVLLRSENSLSRGERELIATYVSSLNDCFFCQHAHGGIAQHYLQCDVAFIDQVKDDYRNSGISDKLKALLVIAGSVQKGGKHVTQEQVDQARKLGATDREIHDTVLISAIFCMFNRYVDGLGTSAPSDRNFYINRGKQRAEEGYAHYDPKN